MSFVAAIVGGVAAAGTGYLLNSAMGGGSPSGGYAGGGWIPPNMQGAANNAYSGIGSLTQNQYAPGVGAAAYNIAMPAEWQAGQQLYNTALDPQNQLYNYMSAQNQNQMNAAEAQRGLAGSAVGAQMSNQANQNFNMNWQNQQLARQAQGVQGMLAAGQGAAGMGNLAYQMGNDPNLLRQQQIQDYLGYSAMGQAGAGQGLSAFNATAPYTASALGAITQPLGQAAGQAFSNWWNAPSAPTAAAVGAASTPASTAYPDYGGGTVVA